MFWPCLRHVSHMRKGDGLVASIFWIFLEHGPDMLQAWLMHVVNTRFFFQTKSVYCSCFRRFYMPSGTNTTPWMHLPRGMLKVTPVGDYGRRRSPNSSALHCVFNFFGEYLYQPQRMQSQRANELKQLSAKRLSIHV